MSKCSPWADKSFWNVCARVDFCWSGILPLPSALLWVCPHDSASEFLGAFLHRLQSLTGKIYRGREWYGIATKADGIGLGVFQFYGASHLNNLAPGHPKSKSNLIKNAYHCQAICSFFSSPLFFLDVLQFVLVVTCFASHLIGQKYLVLGDPLSVL